MEEICKNCKNWHVAESRCSVKGWPTRSDHACDEKSFDPVKSCKSTCSNCKCDQKKDQSKCGGGSCNSEKSDIDLALDDWWSGVCYLTDNYVKVKIS